MSLWFEGIPGSRVDEGCSQTGDKPSLRMEDHDTPRVVVLRQVDHPFHDGEIKMLRFVTNGVAYKEGRRRVETVEDRLSPVERLFFGEIPLRDALLLEAADSQFPDPPGFTRHPDLDPEEVERLVALGSPTDIFLNPTDGVSAIGMVCELDRLKD